MLVPKHIQGDHGWILETGAKKEKTLSEHHNMGPIYESIRATFGSMIQCEDFSSFWLC